MFKKPISLGVPTAKLFVVKRRSKEGSCYPLIPRHKHVEEAICRAESETHRLGLVHSVWRGMKKYHESVVEQHDGN